MFHGETLRLILILQQIIVFQSQSIDLTNAFYQADITRGEPIFIEINSDLRSDGGQCDVVIRFKKILYGQVKTSRIWYEKLRHDFLDPFLLVRKVDP